jgi:hypothetical protein
MAGFTKHTQQDPQRLLNSLWIVDQERFTHILHVKPMDCDVVPLAPLDVLMCVILLAQEDDRFKAQPLEHGEIDFEGVTRSILSLSYYTLTV